MLNPSASAAAVLTDDEKELGVALVDVGGGTTDIAIFVDGAIKHTSVLSLGGNNMTNDIAVGLRTPMAEAEKIKQRYGCCMASLVGKEETIEVKAKEITKNGDFSQNIKLKPGDYVIVKESLF